MPSSDDASGGAKGEYKQGKWTAGPGINCHSWSKTAIPTHPKTSTSREKYESMSRESMSRDCWADSVAVTGAGSPAQESTGRADHTRIIISQDTWDYCINCDIP